MFGNIPGLTGNDKEDVVALYDYVVALRRDLDDALYHLDSDNIAELNATVIRTAISGARIELKHNGIISYNALNQLHGLYYDPASPDAQFRLYHNDAVYFDIERLTGGLYMSAFGTGILKFDDFANLTQPIGEWDFNYTGMVYGFDWSFISSNPFAEYYPSSFAPASGSNQYVKTNGAQNLQLQAFDDRIEVKLGSGDWKVLYFG